MSWIIWIAEMFHNSIFIFIVIYSTPEPYLIVWSLYVIDKKHLVATFVHVWMGIAKLEVLWCI